MATRVLAVATLLLVAGCLGTPTTGGADQPSAETVDSSTEAPNRTVGGSDSPERGETPAYDYGTEFVSVDETPANVSLSDDDAVRFEALSPDRRSAFERALADGRLTFESGNPFSFHDDERPRFVRYEGTWYYVRVAIV